MLLNDNFTVQPCIFDSQCMLYSINLRGFTP